MKHSYLVLLLIFVFNAGYVSAQDKIIKNSGDTLTVRIVKSTEELVQFTYPNEDALHELFKKSIQKVIYANGREENSALAGSAHIKQAEKSLIAGSKIFMEYEATPGEGSVNGQDATNMLKTYIVGKTSCLVVDNLEQADFHLKLQVITRSGGKRKAKVDIVHLASGDNIFDSPWVKGKGSVFYAYSSTRASVGKLVKGPLSRAFPHIVIAE